MAIVGEFDLQQVRGQRDVADSEGCLVGSEQDGGLVPIGQQPLEFAERATWQHDALTMSQHVGHRKVTDGEAVRVGCDETEAFGLGSHQHAGERKALHVSTGSANHLAECIGQQWRGDGDRGCGCEGDVGEVGCSEGRHGGLEAT